VTSAEPAAVHRVFLSYAYDDRALAQSISDALARAGVRTTNQIRQVSSGEDLTARLRETIRASDVVVVLLSQAAAASPRVNTEIEFGLARDLDRRGAELIPVLAAPTDLPPALRNRAVVDLTEDFTAGVRQLVEQIQATSRADFSAMSPRAFEDLVADLLRRVGFRFDEVRHRQDLGVDLRATYQHADPFGSPETEMWLVQAKLYSHQRVSVEAIKRLAAVLAVASSGTRGLLVTNAQLTSVAREYVAELERSPHVRLRVLDGVELKRLLRQFPEITARHFGGDTARSRPESDGDS
jgi:restriction endonuclease Mrr